MQKCYLHQKVKRERMMQNGDILSQLNMIHKSSNILIFTLNFIKKSCKKKDANLAEGGGLVAAVLLKRHLRAEEEVRIGFEALGVQVFQVSCTGVPFGDHAPGRSA